MVKWVTEYAVLTDARIAYRQYGAGPPLLLLHGNSGSKSMFSRYQTDYFPMFHTVAVDSRGHGETESRDDAYSIGQYADDVIALCRVKGFARAYVIGYSDGGNIALHLAKKAPELFPKLAAISPNYLVSGTTEGALRLFQAAARLLAFLGRLGFPTRKAGMRINLMLTDIGLTADDLRSIRTSLRILYAENDLIQEEHILEIGRLIPDASVRKIHRCSHMSIIDKPETVADITQFLMEKGA
ncbi:MAG: alpha/beta hydrolase [Anaerolineales bacterium]|nr:alpha/beta hydrolase [Anaerolineales bacterium]